MVFKTPRLRPNRILDGLAMSGALAPGQGSSLPSDWRLEFTTELRIALHYTKESQSGEELAVLLRSTQ